MHEYARTLAKGLQKSSKKYHLSFVQPPSAYEARKQSQSKAAESAQYIMTPGEGK